MKSSYRLPRNFGAYSHPALEVKLMTSNPTPEPESSKFSDRLLVRVGALLSLVWLLLYASACSMSINVERSGKDAAPSSQAATPAETAQPTTNPVR